MTTVKDLQDYVVLFGYASELYMDHLADWVCHSTTARISAGRVPPCAPK